MYVNETGRGKREEGRGKREEGRGKREEGERGRREGTNHHDTRTIFFKILVQLFGVRNLVLVIILRKLIFVIQHVPVKSMSTCGGKRF
jgi:hypothetical protein